ncbi:hypothetical protein XU18_3396 [Perkinsela sp. CCAP 1560/4]|nr:hypothetical protein XU18_3396 [Perkinsela sp. CCAP 1560/4]|eukprot:KNH05625.1 hypothetical protein XU18_3396 [Perkinsela sp. CCAP 1560/4]
MQWKSLIEFSQDLLANEALSASKRGFHQTSKWLSEMLFGSINVDSPYSENRYNLLLDWFSPDSLEKELASNGSQLKTGRFLLAMNAFQCGEYRRCKSILSKFWSQNPSEISPLEKFFCCYAWYLALEQQIVGVCQRSAEDQRAVEASFVKRGSEVGMEVSSAEWNRLSHAIESIVPQDAYLVYLNALVSKHRGDDPLSVRAHLMNAIKLNPYLWCCWEELIAQTRSIEDFLQLSVSKSSFLYICARAKVRQKYGRLEEAQLDYNTLMDVFPNAFYLRQQLASLMKMLGDPVQSIDLYNSISQLDEFCTDHYLEFSNLLCHHGRRDAIGSLIMQSHLIDPHSTQHNLLVANYFTVAKQHEKAIEYLHRALRGAPTDQTAWVLLGHEYNELGNPEGAIFAFSQGAEVNPNDHRSWYGLGCTYDGLNLEELAEYFLRKAVTCNPMDTRIWFKIANLMDRQQRFSECVDALKQSVVKDDETNSYVYFKLATILEGPLQEVAQAIEYYEKFLCVDKHLDTYETRRSVQKKLAVYYYREGSFLLGPSAGHIAKRGKGILLLRLAERYIDMYFASYDVAEELPPETEKQMMRALQESLTCKLQEHSLENDESVEEAFRVAPILLE